MSTDCLGYVDASLGRHSTCDTGSCLTDSEVLVLAGSLQQRSKRGVVILNGQVLKSEQTNPGVVGGKLLLKDLNSLGAQRLLVHLHTPQGRIQSCMAIGMSQSLPKKRRRLRAVQGSPTLLPILKGWAQ